MSKRSQTPIQVTGQAAGTITGEIPVEGDEVEVIVEVANLTGSVDVELKWGIKDSPRASAETPDTFSQITADGSVAKRFDAKGTACQIEVVITTGPADVTVYTAAPRSVR